MKDHDKTKEQLINELVELRRRVAELEAADTERKRAEEALRRSQEETATRLARLRALREIDRAISSSLEFKDRLDVLLDKLTHLPHIDGASVIVVEPGTKKMETVAIRGLSEEFAEMAEVRLRDGLPGLVVEQEKPLVITDLMKNERVVYRHLMEREELASFLGLPMLAKGELIGVLGIYSRERHRWSQEQTDFLHTLAGQAAIALENARLYEAVQRELTERKRAEEALRALTSRYRAILAAVPDIIMEVDADKVYTWANQAGFKFFGEAVLGKEAAFYFEGEQDTYEMVQPLFDGDENVIYVESWQRRQDGEKRLLAWWCRVLKDANGNVTGALSTARDITERKRAEKELRKVNRALSVLSGCNQAVIRATEESPLLHEVCQIILEVGGYRLVWVGFAEQDEEKIVRPVAQAGFEDGYLETIGITWSDTEGGRGPTGTAIRMGKPCINRNVLTNPDYAPWRDEAIKRGYASSIALPLIANGQTLGALNIYAVKPNGFDTEEVKLLTELADDLAYGIMALRTRAERKRAEEELRRLKEFNETIVQNMAEGVAIEDTEGYLIFVNPAMAAMLGYLPKELLDQHWTAITPPDQHSIVQAADERRLRGEADRYEVELVRKDGRRVAVLVSGSPGFEEGRFTGTLAVFTDITERKRAEQLLQGLNQAALAMAHALTHEQIFAAVAEEIKNLGLSCIVFLTDESQSRLFVRYFSYETGAIKAVEKLTGLKFENVFISIETAGLYGKAVSERKTVFVENVEDVTRQMLPGPAKRFTRQIISLLKIPKSIATPLTVGDEVIGVLSVQSDDLTEDDVPAITAFAHQMAAAWRKAQLMQDLERSLAERERAGEELLQSYVNLQRALEGTVHVLVSVIEMRDPYTAGHQRRVTQLACAIANEMGLPEEQIEGIRMAGLIHDIGKISVPAEILSKPGPLNDLQYGLIKNHARVGHDVLNGTTEFPWPVAQIVLQHHERMDGSGYPQGLSGEEIMLEARIMAVADVVEAMASHRPYRPARGIDQALEEISQNKGLLYDSEVVDACLKLFTEKGFEFE